MATADETASTGVGRRRSDGRRTHEAILDVATRIASVEGLEGLTLGRLAEELEVTKSGVYAHFGSKEQLQLETIEAAQAILEREVTGPAFTAPPGLPRLEALCEAYLSYVERLVFPGGCFFSSLIAEMDAREGRFHEMAQEGARQWWAVFERIAVEARERGEIAAESDIDQLAFELDSTLESANYYYVLLRDPEVIARARRAVAGTIDRARAGGGASAP